VMVSHLMALKMTPHRRERCSERILNTKMLKWHSTSSTVGSHI
jgi:hypothetical protein